MKHVQITVDGVTYNLIKNLDGNWSVTNRAPLKSGEYLIGVTLTTDSGQIIELDTDDEELLEALTLIVKDGTTVSGKRMFEYYPQVIRVILEFQALIYGFGFEIDFLKSDITLTLDNAYLQTMDEERISQWEKALGIQYDSTSTIGDRREVIIATIRGSGKLNTASINAIVGSYTNGGTAISYFENSTLYVEILPPSNNKQYRFENVEKSIKQKIPAHIGLSVTRKYATWGEVKNNFASWQAVSALGNWEDVNLYVPPQ